MSGSWRSAAFMAALRMVGDGPPKNLLARAQIEADEYGTILTPTDLAECLEAAEVTDPFLIALGMQIHKWDAAPPSEPWTEGTPASTAQRRSRSCQVLGIDEVGALALLRKRPIFHDRTIVITAPWERWYTAERAAARAFYWPLYRDQLLGLRGWPAASVTALDMATSDVVQRLMDPTRVSAYQSKGLVVGYVQSGKTANFTGVTAKAIDAGYRLIIVMTGTIEMLRGQTQRRMDMEMVGRQNILGELSEAQAAEAKVDYLDDAEWLDGRYLDLGDGELVTEIRRLTQHRRDYQKQFRTLKIERFDLGRPLFDPDNLFRTSARLAVVKKNAAVLRKLVSDVKANKTAFTEIPVLIIDDESDQASVNTIDPEKVRAAKSEGKEVKERRAINEQIAAMLELIPRAQYVGYTATPFANVFVDPSDVQGIFPKDFVIGLPRPAGYMGVEDFHDLQGQPEGPSPSNSNKAAHVRALAAEDHELQRQNKELATALDAFVLSGAIKLHRQQWGYGSFRHHTMLVHDSVRQAAHTELADRVRDLWVAAEFANPAGKARLQSLFETDFVPVSAARSEQGVPELPSFSELMPYVAAAIGRITEHNQNPVMIVNSDKDVQAQQQQLDFDRYSTWRVLVGGAKLSRGFTVEGLTVTYFRRATKMGDSLTQMGRWFGFRHGYRDLVRLYIAQRARFGRKFVDLYEAFENIARDEAAFRAQLQQYAEWDGEAPRVRPIEIPPLVSQHLPWLQPTARNKMFNAVLEEQSEQPFTPAGYANRPDHLLANLGTWRDMLQFSAQRVVLPEGAGGTNFEALVGIVEAERLVAAIENTKYLPNYRERSVMPKVRFYKRLVSDGSLADALVVVPQPETSQVNIAGVGLRSIVARDRRAGRGGKFGEITEPKHRQPVIDFINGDPPDVLRGRHRSDRGVVLLYLARESQPEYAEWRRDRAANSPEFGIVVAFSFYVPGQALARNPLVLRFRVRDPSNSDAPTVDARSSAL